MPKVVPKKRTLGSVKRELILKSREAALSAIRLFNDPLTKFKSETYIVLMVIAWTYLLHAHYRSKGIEYRYHRQGPQRRRFERTKHGAYKHWELEQCLKAAQCPIDKDTGNNLRFLIGLRPEIEHQMTRSLDDYLSGRYQACALNFNQYLKQLFGSKYSLDHQMAYSIQFLELEKAQVMKIPKSSEIPAGVRSYIAEFDDGRTHDEFNHPHFAFRMLFKRKLVNHPNQADQVVEFIDPNSDLAKAIDKQYWVRKEVERSKYRPSNVVEQVHRAGFSRFRVGPEHVDMWKSEDAKNPDKGYGVDVQGTWYWYDNWVTRCIELCTKAGNKYR